MVRRQKQRRKMRSGRINSNITRIHSHRLNNIVLTAGAATVSLNPTNVQLGSLAEIYTGFDLYRIKRLRFRIHPNAAMGFAQSAAFYPETLVTPSSVTTNSEATDSCVQVKDSSIPSRWVNVPPIRLKGQLDWYKCTPDGSAGELETYGLIAIQGTTTETVNLEIDLLVEFKNPVDASVALARQMERAMEKVKKDFFLVPRTTTDDGTKPVTNK